MAEVPSRAAMLAAIKRLWESGSFVPRSHFRKRLDQRDIPHSWLPRIFETAEIVDGPTWNEEHANWWVRIRGMTIDDDPVTLVLGVDLADDVLYLVTAY